MRSSRSIGTFSSGALRMDCACQSCDETGGAGRPRGALAEFRVANEIDRVRSPFRSEPAADDVQRVERCISVRSRLPAILQGKDRPKDHEEALACAEACLERGLYGASARFYADVIDAKVALPLRWSDMLKAAGTAALAGCGKGKDEPAPDAAAQAAFRRQALDWLRDRLRVQRSYLDLRECKEDPALAGVRDPEALAKLPEAEQVEWKAFWAEVDAQRGGR